jgi:hypothetical protein
VAAPELVPSIITLAPIKGDFVVESKTLPLTVTP